MGSDKNKPSPRSLDLLPLGRSSSQSSLKTTPKTQKEKLSALEKKLLEALFSDSISIVMEEARSRLPKGARIADIFSAKMAKELTQQVNLTDYRAKTASERLDLALRWVTEKESMGIASQVFDLIREISLQTPLEADPIAEQSIRSTIGKAVNDLWVRFSHKIRLELVDAESVADRNRHDELMREYLDVQRRMKECKDFYAG